MSSPLSVPQRSPRKNAQPRSPLQERSHSQANEISSRLVRDTRNDPGLNVTPTMTPYPTKQAHVLRPSALRKQRDRIDEENNIPAIFSSSQFGSGGSSPSLASGRLDDIERPRTANAPALSLKRSVVALRDMYEAQAERSRPTTAKSPVLRPTTSSSSRSRSFSSESLSGRYAWESLHQPSADDMSLLPSRFPPYRDASGTVRTVTSDLESRLAQVQPVLMSSPNLVTIGSSSSPRMPVYKDTGSPILAPSQPSLTSDPTYTSSSIGSTEASSSSPNVVRLDRSSSFGAPSETSSSPNIVKIGISSSPTGSNSPNSDSSPRTIRTHKRKRSKGDELLSFAARSGRANPFPSSPPYDTSIKSSSDQGRSSPVNPVVIRSSPPRRSVDNGSQIDSESDIDRPQSMQSESSGIIQLHSDLQSVISSSPTPAIQYPVVRAPASTSWSGLTVPKRPPRVAVADSVRWTSRLSTVASEKSVERSKANSRRTSASDENYSLYDSESDLGVARAYFDDNEEATNSRVRMVSTTEADHNESEATDFVSALPSTEYRYTSPPPPKRSSSFMGTNSSSSNSRINSMRNSVDTRLNSMKSYTNSYTSSRHNSMRNSQRPGSSGSMTSNFHLPTWAHRYYSGIYQDSFQALYASQTDLSNTNPYPNGIGPAPRPLGESPYHNSYSSPGRPSLSNSAPRSRRGRRSMSSLTSPAISIRSVTRRVSPLVKNLTAVFRPRTRPHVNPRNSHLEPGVGPLVSNPVRPPTAHLITPQHVDPADPRAHWAGAKENQDATYRTLIHHQNCRSGCNHSYLPQKNRMYQPSSWSRSPHLHREDRNRDSDSFRHRAWPRFRAAAPPSLDERAEKLISLRNAHVACFVLGFITIIPWWVGALFLPLPTRPEKGDLEKRASGDIIGRLKRESAERADKRWENTRWWRGVNRWMSVVGVVVVVLVVLLSVLGTRAGGF